MNIFILRTLFLLNFSFMALSVNTSEAAEAELLLSISPERTSPTILNGALISGNVYIYVAPSKEVTQASFYLDDPNMINPPIRSERLDSYDFSGTDQSTGKAYPFDTASLEPGDHTISSQIEFRDGSVEIAQARFKYFPPDAPLALISNAELMVSTLPGRLDPTELDQSALNGDAYIFVAQASGVKQVAFYLDDPDMLQIPVKVERFEAYDFAGTNDTTKTAYPYDLSQLIEGGHTLAARIDFVDDSFRTLQADFVRTKDLVQVPIATPSPEPSSVPAPKPPAAPGPVLGSAKKWNPGHYLNAYWGTDMPGSLNKTKPYAFLKGVSVIHQWRELEPTKGSYNFSRIESELAMAKAQGKQLMIQINDRTFWKNWPDCVPDYLINDPIYKGGQSHIGIKCTALRWVPAVQDRLIALYRALGQKFNGDPNFEAIFVEEDGVETAGDNMSLYSSRGYTDQEKRGMDALAASFPNTQVFKFLSWGPNVGELFAYAKKLGLGVGGPDLVPDSKTFSTSFYTQYSGKIPLHISSQDPRVNQYIEQGGSVERMLDFAISDPAGLHVNYIIWDQPNYPNFSYKRDILPLLEARQGYINTGCPTSIVCQ
ncbi:hypothetical protein [Methyloterricola oryzae]|uniref:hypothetical protein n=1 Tax=Methyloterricola oryzae TaxID=1495050 RepID=UPI0005EB0C0C|nr:hypothetical protein [Methyloterricola oryzae]